MSSQRLGPEDDFPNLTDSNHRITSPADSSYNCIGWAAETTDWWEPDLWAQCYWLTEAPRQLTIPAFVRAYETLGYAICDSPDLEVGYQKIAVFAKGTLPTHVARQLVDGSWTSKLGELEDIEHATLGAVEGPFYGTVAVVMRRPAAAT